MPAELFDKIHDIKDFVSWARAEGAMEVKIGEIEVKFFEPLGIPDFTPPAQTTDPAVGDVTGPAPQDVPDDVLFHSSDP